MACDLVNMLPVHFSGKLYSSEHSQHFEISIMSLRDLLESGANVSVTVTLDDLRAIFNEAAKGGRIFGALRNRDQRPRTGSGNVDEIE